MAKLTELRPMLIANDLAETIAFYESIGFECTGRYPEDGGDFVWCEVARDGVALMFNQGDPEPHDHGDGEMHAHTPALAGAIYINSDGVDALFAELKDRVDEFDFEPTDQPHGMREFGLEDPNGYLLLFGQPIAP